MTCISRSLRYPVRRTWRALGAVALVAAMGLGPPAHGRQVDDVAQGDFYHVGEDAPADLMGSAKVARFDDDTTSLQVHAHGLEPGATYTVHLHSGACADRGPHYRDKSDGPGRPPNELWASSDPNDPTAGVTADGEGNVRGWGSAPWRARSEARSVFMHSSTEGHHAIGCADLS